MTWKNKPDRYGTPAKGLHWLSALIVLGLLPLGFFMVSLDFSNFKLSLYWWHKSFGTLLLFIVSLRLLWRLTQKQPPPLEAHKIWERRLAHVVHALLYIGMIGMPLSGWLMSAASDFANPFFGLFNMPDIIPGRDEELFRLMRAAHEFTAYALLLAIGLHGLGAFKHHFIDRDITLTRMLPALYPKAVAALAVIVFVAMAGLASVLAARHLVQDQQSLPAQIQTMALQQAEEQGAAGAGGISDIQRWTIIQDRSQIGFAAKVQGQSFEGQFTRFDGDIYFDPDNLEKSFADIRVFVASVATGSEERDQYIVMPAWLDAESFPESRFVTKDIKKTGEEQYIAAGTLTMHGISRPVDVPFTLTITEDEQGRRYAAMQGAFPIHRLDFGVGEGEWSNTDLVSNALTVSVSLYVIAE